MDKIQHRRGRQDALDQDALDQGALDQGARGVAPPALGPIGLGLVAACALLSGCADLMTRSVVAPSWFQAKAVEVKGEGYPDLHKVPVVRGNNKNTAAWDAENVDLRGQSQKIEAVAAETPAGATPDPEAIRARAAQLRAQTENGPTSPPSGAER